MNEASVPLYTWLGEKEKRSGQTTNRSTNMGTDIGKVLAKKMFNSFQSRFH